MKYLAVVEIKDQCYDLHEVSVVEGYTGANELADRIEEELECYCHDISFYPFENPEQIIKDFEYIRFYPDKHVAFDVNRFLDFIGKYEEIDIDQMEEFESTGLYRRKYDYCVKCRRENYTCTCKITEDIGLTIIKH